MGSSLPFLIETVDLTALNRQNSDSTCSGRLYHPVTFRGHPCRHSTRWPGWAVIDSAEVHRGHAAIGGMCCRDQRRHTGIDPDGFPGNSADSLIDDSQKHGAESGKTQQEKNRQMKLPKKADKVLAHEHARTSARQAQRLAAVLSAWSPPKLMERHGLNCYQRFGAALGWAYTRARATVLCAVTCCRLAPGLARRLSLAIQTTDPTPGRLPWTIDGLAS